MNVELACERLGTIMKDYMSLWFLLCKAVKRGRQLLLLVYRWQQISCSNSENQFRIVMKLVTKLPIIKYNKNTF